MYGYIYKRVNKTNGMIYVGQHKYELLEIGLDINYRGSGKYLKRAIAKYGEDNFTYELIATANTPEELNEKEIFWIKELDCITPKGYNIAIGGVIRFDKKRQRRYSKKGNKKRGTGWKQTEKQKEAVRKVRTGYKASQETRSLISKANLGNTKGSGNKGLILVNDGVRNTKIKPEDFNPTIYTKGWLRGLEYLLTMLKLLADRVYVNKDGKSKYVKYYELVNYLKQGYQLGRSKETYKERGKSISEGKKNTIKIVNSNGTIKYIKPNELPEYEKLGYIKTKKK